MYGHYIRHSCKSSLWWRRRNRPGWLERLQHWWTGCHKHIESSWVFTSVGWLLLAQDRTLFEDFLLFGHHNVLNLIIFIAADLSRWQYATKCFTPRPFHLLGTDVCTIGAAQRQGRVISEYTKGSQHQRKPRCGLLLWSERRLMADWGKGTSCGV